MSAGQTTVGSPPNGTYGMGYHLLEYGTGFAGHILNSTVDTGNYHPIASGKGGGIAGSMKKLNTNDHAPLFFLVNGTDVRSARGYILGLSEDNPSRLLLRKGSLIAPHITTGDDVLQVSDDEFPVGSWHQVELFVGVNAQDDVRLEVWMDATPAYPPTTAESVDGMPQMYDDPGGIVTGSLPVVQSFYLGIGVRFGGTAGAVGLFDYLIAKRQT